MQNVGKRENKKVKLFEHPDFEQAIIRATEYFRSSGMRESVIEKDYYVTEALRIIQQAAGSKVIFKGGTSLSKGWNIIKRFSEDVDIFLDPSAFVPSLGKNAINRELKNLKQSVECHPGLKFIEHESRTIGGFGRSDYFEYVQRFASTGDIRNRVLIEVGTGSGKDPTECVKIHSYVGQFLRETGVTLDAEDEGSFDMHLLHFRRTFVEKLFAIHSKVEKFKRTGIGVGSYARHYYDLFCLSERKEVLEMLRSNEYEAIKADYDRVSRKHFEAQYVAPPDMDFSKSEAIFPQGNISTALGIEFERQCRVLCYDKFPSWPQVQQRFEEIRDFL